ncbi:unnamed protein product [Toxocara canis]|uniref:Uncharacterized protein n=1 Tax=Toxocara canis TaxID=6265 RepID=A0A3P7I023_TOXCA|nr:unnamed protein product [Toxocara canis]
MKFQISLDKLSDLKFPTKAERHVETLSSQESNGVSLQCQFEPARTQLLHVPMNIVTSQKDALRLKAANELCGTVFITERITTADEARVDFGTGTAGMTPEADNGHGEDATDTFNFEIHSIRKKPTLPIEGVRERVKAFGVSRKKKRDKLPNLITSK